MRLFSTRTNAISSGSLLLTASLSHTASFCVPRAPYERNAILTSSKDKWIALSTTRDMGTRIAMHNKSSSNSESTQKPKKKKKNNGKKSINDGEEFRADRVLSTRACISRSEASAAIKEKNVAYKLYYDDTDDNDDNDDNDNNIRLTPLRSSKIKIPMNAIIYMDGKPIPQLPPILMAYHKAKNVLSAYDEKHSSKKHLGMMIPERFKKIGMHPVGRLDYDTSGLILFSRNGELTQRLLHPRHEVEKEYVATVCGGSVDVQLLKSKLEENGVETSEGIHFANLSNVQEIDQNETEAIISQHLTLNEEDSKSTNVQSLSGPLTNIRLVVQEGKYRMVRRMLANCGHPVVELQRERHGIVQLNDLKVGSFRDCTIDEIEWANSLLQGSRKK